MVLYQICVLLGWRSVTFLRSLKESSQQSSSTQSSCPQVGVRELMTVHFLHYSEEKSWFSLVYCHQFCSLLTSDIDMVWTFHRIGAWKQNVAIFIQLLFQTHLVCVWVRNKQHLQVTACSILKVRSTYQVPSCAQAPLIYLYRHYTSNVCVVSKCH